jgi:hypothetical protein
VIGPGETFTLQQNLFSVGLGSIDNFVQVSTSSQNDPDSTPGNDTDGNPDEDDESLANVIVSGNTVSADAGAQLFVSSNTEGIVGVFNIFEDNTVSMLAKETSAMDADGIHYDDVTDRLTQLNRSNNRIDIFSDVNANLGSDDPLNLIASSTSDFTNGREIAVNKEVVIAAQDAADSNGNQNALVVYEVEGSSISRVKTHNVDINLWGTHIIETTLWAVVDNSNQLAVYTNVVSAPDGPITPTMIIDVEDIVRTHGLTYIPARDMLILTDVGSGADATDGAFSVVRNLTAAAADGFISNDEQVRIGGDRTFLGNPVDVAYDELTDRVFLAERANGGGRVLGFNLPTEDGNIYPDYNQSFAGASAIFSNGVTASKPSPTADNAIQERTQQAIEIGTIYPVPAKNTINLSVNATESGMTTFIVYDVNGKAVSSFNYEIFIGQNIITQNISQYPAGYYYLKALEAENKMDDADISKAHKFLKVD